MDQVRDIAQTQKMADLNAASVETAMNMIAGTARSMGIESTEVTGRPGGHNIRVTPVALAGTRCRENRIHEAIPRVTTLFARRSIGAKRYHLDEAMTILKENTFAKFDESVEVAVRLGVNPKHADQMVRGTVALPHGTGKSVRVAVFAQGEKAEEAQERRRRHCRCRRSRGEDQRRLDRFRRGHGHAGHDARARQAG